MKTTIVFEDNLYEMLREASRKEFESERKLSAYVNKIVSDFLTKKKSKEMFGLVKPFDYSGYRDYDDRFA